MIRTVLLAVAMTAAATAVFAQSRDRVDPYRAQQIVAELSGLCMDVKGEQLRMGAEVIVWRCHGGANQRFHVRPVGRGDNVQLVVGDPRGEYCLHAPSSKGQSLSLAPCRHGGEGQTWWIDGRGFLPLISRTGYCANIEGERREPGTRVITWPCVGAVNERWRLTAAR